MRGLALGDVGLVDPTEIDAVEVAVAHAELHAVVLQVIGLAGVGDGLAVHHLPHGDASIFQGEQLQGLRPEEGEAVRQDHSDEPHDHQDAEAEGASGQPDHRLTARSPL